MKRYGPRYFKPDAINFANHWAADTQWAVVGSKGDQYTVEMTTKGFTCDCTGMKMHGKCKHSRAIAEEFING